MFQFDIEKHMSLSKVEVQNLNKIKKYDQWKWFVDVKTMLEGETFGELALINNDPRAATIYCETDSYFGVIHKNDYDRFLRRIHNKSMQKDIDFFNSLPFFGHWTIN